MADPRDVHLHGAGAGRAPDLDRAQEPAARARAGPGHDGLRGGRRVPGAPPRRARHRPRRRGVRRLCRDGGPGADPRRLAARPVRARAVHHRRGHRRIQRPRRDHARPVAACWRSPAPWRWAPRSRMLLPSLALLVVNRVPESRRGAAMGTFTAFFDVGRWTWRAGSGRGRGRRRLLRRRSASPQSRRPA